MRIPAKARFRHAVCKPLQASCIVSESSSFCLPVSYLRLLPSRPAAVLGSKGRSFCLRGQRLEPSLTGGKGWSLRLRGGKAWSLRLRGGKGWSLRLRGGKGWSLRLRGGKGWSLRLRGGKGWSLRLRGGKGWSLRLRGGKGWSLRLRGAKAGAFAYAEQS